MFFSKIHIYFLIIVAFSSSNRYIFANDPVKKYETGIFYGAVSARNDFLNLADTVNCCPNEYEPGSGFSLIIPINYYKKLYKDLYLLAGLSYQYDDLIFSYTEQQAVRGETALIKHFINSKRNFAGLNLGFSYSINKVSINTSLNGLYSINSVFDQRETLISSGAFDTLGTKVRNEFESIESELSTNFSLRLLSTISYSVNFKDKYEFLPNIGFQFDLLSQHKDNNWFNTGIYFGLTFRYLIENNNSTSPIDPSNKQ